MRLVPYSHNGTLKKSGSNVHFKHDKMSITGLYSDAFIMQDLFEQTLNHNRKDNDLKQDVRNDETLLLWAVDAIAHSPAGFALVKNATQSGWNLGIDHLGTGGFHLDVPDKEITIDHYGLTAKSLIRDTEYRNAFLMVLIQALREVAQEDRFGALERSYKPEAILMLERVRAADALSYAMLIAWEMRSAGYPDLWRYLLSSEDSDMALALNNVLDCDPASFIDGSAIAQVFRQWFASHARIDLCDHETLDTLDMVMSWAEEQSAQDQTAPMVPFGDKMLESSVVEELCQLSSGASYLRGMGESICTDPVFSAMNNEINEAHLFQIVYDLEVYTINNVPFRDRALARKVFPDGKIGS